MKTRRDLLKALGIEHLNNEEFHLLDAGALDKKSLVRAVRHLSECQQCCRLASKLSAEEIKDALTDTPYSREELVKQTTEYYFETLAETENS